jgi:hypothetical protein
MLLFALSRANCAELGPGRAKMSLLTHHPRTGGWFPITEIQANPLARNRGKNFCLRGESL